ncbi:hypothetical protein FA13DRAFT_1683010 [Coprinellus micaceus]|uniref:BTB domain-containing protein n=1 Tax=Coprinellus micaceus TaxID=71717 RepID=A0A4Y7TTS4_COPMI|nr:hypothetical protein FA13DRAFT_1683010 [Coprinellus micaceus]
MSPDSTPKKRPRRPEELPKCPSFDCTLTIDIIFLSCDGVHVGAHKQNLDNFSDGFPSPDLVQAPDASTLSGRCEVVELTEDAATLNILLQFMHKTRFPKVHELSTEQLFSLAEAAEKYMVYSAMSICNDRIEQRVIDYPVQALCYAAKFHYSEIADIAASYSVACPFDEIRKYSKSHHATIYAWFQYREFFIELADAILNPPVYINNRNQEHTCSFQGPYLTATSALLPKTNTKCMQMLAEKGTFDASVYNTHRPMVHGCTACPKRIDNWIAQVQGGLCKDFPAFTSFMT